MRNKRGDAHLALFQTMPFESEKVDYICLRLIMCSGPLANPVIFHFVAGCNYRNYWLTQRSQIHQR